MTPLEELRKAELYFADGEKLYYFVIPFGRSWTNYTKRIRELAKKRHYNWKVAHVEGRRWRIKIKV